MNKVLKQAVEDASYERSGSGQGVPTKKELARLLKTVDRLNEAGNETLYDFIDAQHDLINALLVKLYV